MLVKWAILKRDNTYKFEAYYPNSNPLYGNGSWDLVMDNFNSCEAAEAWLDKNRVLPRV